jgi:hypothetical protein
MPYKDPEKRREQVRRWRQNNPERSREIQKRYREANRERVRGNQRSYREANREKINAKARGSVEKNRERGRKWRFGNPERSKQHTRVWVAANKEKRIGVARTSHLKITYKLTPREWDEMFVNQEGRCAICHKHHNDCPLGLQVDHDHKTKRVRGLLCQSCNTGIGHLREDVELLSRAIEYLQNS